jgi:hypothetical protein
MNKYHIIAILVSIILTIGSTFITYSIAKRFAEDKGLVLGLKPKILLVVITILAVLLQTYVMIQILQ